MRGGRVANVVRTPTQSQTHVTHDETVRSMTIVEACLPAMRDQPSRFTVGVVRCAGDEVRLIHEGDPRAIFGTDPAIFERLGSTQIQADGRTRKERARAPVSVAVRGLKRPRIGRDRKNTFVCAEFRAD